VVLGHARERCCTDRRAVWAVCSSSVTRQREL